MKLGEKFLGGLPTRRELDQTLSGLTWLDQNSHLINGLSQPLTPFHFLFRLSLLANLWLTVLEYLPEIHREIKLGHTPLISF